MALKVLAFACVFVGAGAFLHFANAFVQSSRTAQTGPLVLAYTPQWVSADLEAAVTAAAGAQTFELTAETAREVALGLQSVAWLYDVRVTTTHESVRVDAAWRKPVALIKAGRTSFYIDSDLTVLDFVELPALPIVSVEGVTVAQVPPAGTVLDREDLRAATALLGLLAKMDAKLAAQRPLLGQIRSIDVSNFEGRRSPRKPHIVLYSKDGTEIVWGAEVGAWSRHLEAKDEDKLARLYSYYRRHGSLSAGARYINLLHPQDKIPQPIDKYH